MKFSLIFLGYQRPEDVPEDPGGWAGWLAGGGRVCACVGGPGAEAEAEVEAAAGHPQHMQLAEDPDLPAVGCKGVN
jgi:hypothetical protein